MKEDYNIEIEYMAKETLSINALSEAWAILIAKEKWEQERSEPMITVKIIKRSNNG